MQDKHRLVNLEEKPEPPRQDSQSPGSNLIAGQVFDDGRYLLIRCLGRGGMGVVWLARDQRLGEDVALKLLPPEIAGDAVALDDLRRETLKSRKLTHPNIVRIHDLHEKTGETPFISMEYIDGPNLFTLRKEQPGQLFAWEFLRPIVRQLCDALEYAHSERVIHRDLKPANMMLDQRGRLKLADFGIAAMVMDSANRISLRQLSSGTPNYMSPQQMEGQISRPTDDIYSLGATLYELLASQPPFYGDDIVQQVTTRDPQAINERLAELNLANQIPEEVVEMVMACLAKDPAQRPQSARDVAERIGLELAPPSHELPAPSAPGFEDQADPEANPQRPAERPTQAGERRGATSWKTVGIVIATVLLLLGSGLAFLFFTKRVSIHQRPGTADSRVNPPGALDPTFDPGSGIEGNVHGTVMLEDDGKIIIAGRFGKYNDLPRSGVARLDPNGTIDDAVDPQVAGTIHDAAIQPNGKIVIVGDFKSVNGEGYHSVARLNPDLSVDHTFRRGTGGNLECRCVAIQPNGKIVIGGSFTTFHSAPHQRLVRLNADGSPDAGFNTASGADLLVWTVASQSDNRVIAGGRFRKFKGIPRAGVARVNEDGSLDEAFSPGFGGPTEITAVAVDPVGRILVGGHFTKSDSTDKALLRRFLPDGRPDSTFVTSSIGGSGILVIAPRNDGKIILAGGLTVSGAVMQMGITEINSNGTVVTNAPLGAQIDGAVWSTAVQPDGRIIVYGSFNKVGGVARRHIARLYGDKP